MHLASSSRVRALGTDPPSTQPSPTASEKHAAPDADGFPRAATTTRLPVARTAAHQAGVTDFSMVTHYPSTIVRLRVEDCLAHFVALTGAGFFAHRDELGIPAPASAAYSVCEHPLDDLPTRAHWSLRVSGLATCGTTWLAHALDRAGARVEWSGLPYLPQGNDGWEQAARAPLPFRVLSRRGTMGFHVRLTLGRSVDAADEAAFRELVRLWTQLLQALPARDGRGRARLTTRPAFERGGNVLAVAGRLLDGSDNAARVSLLSALAQLHGASFPIVEALLELP